MFVLGVFLVRTESYAKLVHSTIEDSRDLRIKLNAEEEAEYLKNQSSYWDSCPTSLILKVKDDAKINVRNWYGKKEGSSDDYCFNALSKVIETPDETELSKRLSSHPLTSLDKNGSTLSWRCINSIKDPNHKKFLVAEYHSNMARLKITSLASLESISSIDSLLGKNSLENIECPKDGIPAVVENCEKLKACEAQGGLDVQARELQSVYPEYAALKEKLERLRHFKKEFPSLYKENEEKIQAIESIYPTLKGKEFLKILDPKKRNFSEALKQQLEKSREKIVDQFNQYQKGVSCMRGLGGCTNFDEILSTTSFLNVEDFRHGETFSKEDAEVRDYLGSAQCRQIIRKVSENQAEAIKNFSIGTALALTTIGIGSYAAYCRATVSAIENSIILPSLVNRSVVLDAAVNISQKATIASRTVLGFDLLALGRNGLEAYDHCAKELNQLSVEITKKIEKDESPRKSICPSELNKGFSQPQLVANYRSCVAKSVLAGVTGMILPQELRRSIEGPLTGGFGLFKRGVVTFSQANEKEREAKKKRKIIFKESEQNSSSQKTLSD